MNERIEWINKWINKWKDNAYISDVTLANFDYQMILILYNIGFISFDTFISLSLINSSANVLYSVYINQFRYDCLEWNYQNCAVSK